MPETKAVIATAAPAYLAILTNAHVGIIVSALCGSLIFILWADSMSGQKRFGYWVIGSVLGVFIGPSLADWSILKGIPPAVSALLVGAFSVTFVNIVLEIVIRHDLPTTIVSRYKRSDKEN